MPDEQSRSISELCAAEVRGEPYCHEIVRVLPGRAFDLLAAVRAQGEAAHAGRA